MICRMFFFVVLATTISGAPALAQIIAGAPVSSTDERNRGLVSVLGCSGVLLTESWVLTAGHCFAENSRPQRVPIRRQTEIRNSDRIYVMGAETNSKGDSNDRGYDLALIHLQTPFDGHLTTAGGGRVRFKQSPIFQSSISVGQSLVFFGQGVSTYYMPGPPPASPSGSGTWRTTSLPVTRVESQTPNADAVVALPSSDGQICAPGDSGGPVFLIDGKDTTWLLGIIRNGEMECANPAACKSTLTRVKSCTVNTLPKRVVDEIMARPWKPNATTQVLTVSDELGVNKHLFYDPSRENAIDMNVRLWAVTGRAAEEMCMNRGFLSGRMTGHQQAGKSGIACAGGGAVWSDAAQMSIDATGFSFDDVDKARWAQANRAAAGICGAKAFAGGHFNGHQIFGSGIIPTLRGVICYGAPAQWFDAPMAEINSGPWPVGDLNMVGWAQASRAAMTFCERKGFLTGFMNGHQANGKYGVVCQN